MNVAYLIPESAWIFGMFFLFSLGKKRPFPILSSSSSCYLTLTRAFTYHIIIPNTGTIDSIIYATTRTVIDPNLTALTARPCSNQHLHCTSTSHSHSNSLSHSSSNRDASSPTSSLGGRSRRGGSRRWDWAGFRSRWRVFRRLFEMAWQMVGGCVIREVGQGAVVTTTIKLDKRGPRFDF
jgi:hypothetical protein